MDFFFENQITSVTFPYYSIHVVINDQVFIM